MSRRTGTLILLGTAAALALVVVHLAAEASAREGWRLATRDTARLGLLIFLLAYVASSLRQLSDARFTRTMLSNRRGLGLAFASVMAVHVGAIFGYAISSSDPHIVHVRDSGGAVYVIIGLMALTSNDKSMKLLGPWWSRLHWLGAQLILAKFASLLLARTRESENAVAIGLLGLIVAAVGLRCWAYLRGRQYRTS